MNKKGFTLIELLAVIIVLGIVLVMSVPNLTETFNKSKLKNEEVFTQRLSQTIDSYVSLNSDNLMFIPTNPGKKTSGRDEDGKVKYYEIEITTASINFKNIMDAGLMNSSDFINAGNKEENCNTNAEIEVYRDSDYVYCHKVKASELECLSQKYINEYKSKKRAKLIEEGKTVSDEELKYVINTCVWEK